MWQEKGIPKEQFAFKYENNIITCNNFFREFTDEERIIINEAVSSFLRINGKLISEKLNTFSSVMRNALMIKPESN